jgi:DNA adenine methylase
MKPIFKYSGGKKRESKFIASLTGDDHLRTVEPFAGSAALSFYYEKPALVADVRKDVIATFKAVQDPVLYPQLQARCDALSLVTDIKELERAFYAQRDEMWGCTDVLDIAWRFIVIRQLVFSGMDRINVKTGKENAPFGWYKQFKCNLSLAHHELLQTWEVAQQPFEQTFTHVREGDLVFSDPPYLDRNSTYDGTHDPGQEMHQQLQSLHDTCQSPWMLVHCKHSGYDAFASRHRLTTKEFMYSQNFVGRDNTKSKTQHIYVQGP